MTGLLAAAATLIGITQGDPCIIGYMVTQSVGEHEAREAYKRETGREVADEGYEVCIRVDGKTYCSAKQ